MLSALTSAARKSAGLLAACVEWVRDRRPSHLEVAMHAFNKDARRFYEGSAFQPSIDRLMLVA